MKIAFAYDLPYPWHKGGIEKILYAESTELAKANEVHFFALRWPGMEKDFIKDNIHYHVYFNASINTIYRHGRRSIRKAFSFAIALLHLFKYRFDVLIIDQFPYVHIPIAWLFCRLTGCKLIIKVAEVWDKEYWKSYTNGAIGAIAYPFSKFWVKRADFYIADSSTTKGKLEKFVNRSGAIMIFSPVLKLEDIKSAKVDAAKDYGVIFVGRLIKEKRLDKWVDAVSKAHGINGAVKGAIIGEGIEKENIKTLLKQNNANSFISLIGGVENTSDLYSVIASSKLLLNMSEREGLSIISLESLALGTPVLLPSYTPIPEEVKRMCITEAETAIPEKIVEIFSSTDKSKFLKNTEGLNSYYTSSIQKYYETVFEKIGIKNAKNASISAE